jgi:hypothetical protein
VARGRAGGDDDLLGDDKLLADLDLPAGASALPTKAPWPLRRVTLFFLNRPLMPPVSWSTMPDLRAIILGTSILGVPTLMPWPSKAWPASSNRCEVCSSALDGMQPTFRQVPPRRGSPLGSA